ncbi:ferritin heavy chain [Bombyx mori]|uniref:Ferritin n=1 Tax=Bombyx mori TaxID=7091 RepID=A0A8R1WKS0_BOMMO|nr:ferritin heavy chain [Bombyx mori]
MFINRLTVSNKLKLIKVKFYPQKIIIYNYSNVKKHTACKIADLINRQIQTEQQVAQHYLSLAVTFLNVKSLYHGAGGFFMKMYFEELDHMQGFIKYQLIRGNIPNICGIEKPNLPDNLPLIEAFRYSLKMEEQVNQLLEEIVTEANDIKDYHCADFVTSVYLSEQIQSINEINHYIIKLSSFGDDIHAIHNFDTSLIKLFPFSNRLNLYKTKL